MSKFAFHDVYRLLNTQPPPEGVGDLSIRYICALFSELAYYHIPQWEIDNWKRAMIVPCEAYKTLVALGRPTNVSTVLQQFDIQRGFVVEDRGVIVVGTVINRMLFIGFRGTRFLFDWKINARSRLARIDAPFPYGPRGYRLTVAGNLHSGFTEEAMRISIRIADAIRDAKLGEFDHVFLTGHSLGGAVAAISENFLRIGPTSVCIFGAPRYSDVSAYVNLLFDTPTQVRRPGDVVPTIPPKFFGYVDHPHEFKTDGSPYFDPAPYSSAFGDFVRWWQFLRGRFEAHSMERYREEMGLRIKAPGARLQLVPAEKLTKDNIAAM